VVVEADAAADSVADAHRLSATTAKKKATSPGSALKAAAAVVAVLSVVAAVETATTAKSRVTLPANALRSARAAAAGAAVSVAAAASAVAAAATEADVAAVVVAAPNATAVKNTVTWRVTARSDQWRSKKRNVVHLWGLSRHFSCHEIVLEIDSSLHLLVSHSLKSDFT